MWQVSSLLQKGWSVGSPVPQVYCPKTEVTFSSMTPPQDVAQLCVNGHHLYPESHMGATTSMVNSPTSRGTNSTWEML